MRRKQCVISGSRQTDRSRCGAGRGNSGTREPQVAPLHTVIIAMLYCAVRWTQHIDTPSTLTSCKWAFPSSFLSCTFLLCLRATCPAHLMFLNATAVPTMRFPPVVSLRTLSSHTLSLCSFLRVTDRPRFTPIQDNAEISYGLLFLSSRR